MVEKLLDVCDFQGGTQPPKDEWVSEPKDGYIRMLQIRDYTQGDEKFIEYVLDNGKLHKCTQEDIMLSRYGYIGQAFTGLAGAYNVALVKVIKKKPVHNPYLLYYFKSGYFQHHLLDNVGARATIPGFNKSELKNAVINIPSQEKQEYISGNLGKIEGIIALRQQELQKLDNLIKVRFVEMFGDPFSNPLNWECISFKESSLRLSDGPFGSNLKSEHYSETGVRVIRLGNIGVGRFIDEDKSFIPPEHYENLKKYTCHAGEIVIGTLGDPNLRACIIPKEIGIAVNKADCVHYIPNPSLLNTEFACQYVNCPETLLLAHGMIHGQTRSRVSSGQIAEMPIFIPPLELQNVFSDFVHQIDKSKSAIQKSLDETQLLFDSLMQQYFG
ncbi:MAG: restriction endonuclease subunit S [Oscillospiraceae bacterium]|nr:restriction endonuclease subunit S [Oscillospiraceae bacterium]